MMLNRVERWAMNNPIGAAHQHSREAGWFRRRSRSLGGLVFVGTAVRGRAREGVLR